MAGQLISITPAMLAHYLAGKLAASDMDAIEAYLRLHPEALTGLSAVPDDRLVEQVRLAAKEPPIHSTDTVVLGTQTSLSITAPKVAAPLAPDLQNHPRYQLQQKIGQGGMGAVYLAQHKIMGRQVAIKIIQDKYLANSRMIERFHREINSAARLNHPNIVTAYDAEQVGGTHFLAMEYVEGESVKEYLLRLRPLPVADACDIIRQAAIGLQHAHEKGMVHRDIKPHNLMRTPDGKVKILDFGLATLRIGDEQLTDITGSGIIIGTPDYIAPEQAQNTHNVDIRADIYALGCSLFELLTGQTPFESGTTVDKLIAHRQQQAVAVRSLRPEVPEALDQIVRRMIAKAPADRYQTPSEVAEALQPFVTPFATVPIPRRRPRSLGRIAAAVLVLAVIVAAVGGVYKVTNSHGDEFTITTNDPNLEVIVKNGGKEVYLFDPISKQKLKLDTEKFQLSDADKPDGLTIELPGKEPIVLRRKGERVATVTRTGVKGKDDNEHVTEVRRFGGADHGINRLAISPDGTHALTAGRDGSVRYWEVATGKLILNLPASQRGMVYYVAISPDGKSLFSCGTEQRIQIWDASTGKKVKQLREPEPLHRDYTALAVSKDGKWVATGSMDGALILWDLEKGEAIHNFRIANHHADGVAFSPDGTLLASWGIDTTIRLWDVKSRKQVHNLSGHFFWVGAGAFSADGKRFLSADYVPGGNGTLCLWDVQTGKLVRSMDNIPGGSSGVAISPNGMRGLSGGPEGVVNLWDLETGKKLAAFPGRDLSRNKTGVEFLPDGLHVLSTGGQDGLIQLWRLPRP